jgi:sterol desaturase/sphingolipid hydroxylase (fatty acid hydroxylase superfamily)
VLFSPTVIAIPVFVFLIVLEGWYDARTNAGEYERRDTSTNIGLGLISVVWGALFGIAQVLIYVGLYEITPLRVPVAAWWAWPAVLLLDDFCYYWFHRFSHEMRFFWNFHVVHHSSDHYNLSVAVRQSWFGGLVSWVFYAPIALLGFPPWMIVTAHGFNLIYQFWIHTRFIRSLGPLEYVLNTPAHHRVHHGVNNQYLDRNYAGALIIWDRLFGTFIPETETPRYGIIKPLNSYNMMWVNCHAWSEMFAEMRARSGIRSKMRCVFGAPAMEPPAATSTVKG